MSVCVESNSSIKILCTISLVYTIEKKVFCFFHTGKEERDCEKSLREEKEKFIPGMLPLDPCSTGKRV